MDFDFRPNRRRLTQPEGPQRRRQPLLAMLLRLWAAIAALPASLARSCLRALRGPGQNAPRPPFYRRPLVLLVLVAGVAAITLAAYAPRDLFPLADDDPVQAAQADTPELRRQVIEGTIRSGDTMTALLGEYFDDQQLHSLINASRPVYPLSDICTGQPYKLCINAGEFESFEYDIDRDHQLIIRREQETFDISRIPIAYTIKSEVIRGSISSSLFEAINQAGETDALAVMLADIFAYDIDFIRDLRTGDAFQIVAEKRFRDGKPAGYGRILAATFTNQGETYTAFLFKDGKNPATYYNADGKALRKAFLKAPLHFSRISSGFTMRRFHPIAKTWRAHPAIDYAAPAGTPIMAIGDGTIARIGRSSGNGNFIRLRHANGIESMYLHMSRFARGMRQGKRVLQGQAIGYVGSTGLATGPHLCFRMFSNGSPLNPARLKSTTAAPVSRDRLAEFRTVTAPLLARLEGREVQQAAAVSAPDQTPP